MKLSVPNLYIWIILLSFLSCNPAEDKLILPDLINDHGWYAYEFVRVNVSTGNEFTGMKPYIILGEYGSAVKFHENGTCLIGYSDGLPLFPPNAIEMEWVRSSEDTIIIKTRIGSIEPEILVYLENLTYEECWISYILSNAEYHYKMRKIE